MRQILTIAGFIFLGMANAVRSQGLTPAEEPLVKVVNKTLPAVVNITAEQIVKGRINDPFSAFFGRYYEAPQGTSLGSGVLISSNGYVVTCDHVVDGANRVWVTLYTGEKMKAKVVTEDPEQDLALLQIGSDKSHPNFAFLETKQISPNLLGETVVALGNPVGYQNSISRGILSAKDRTINTEEGKMGGLLQTDAAINPGNSGGPMVDIEGKFVGICSAKATGEAIGGLGFGIPAEVVVGWANDAIAVAKGEKSPPPLLSSVDVIQKRFGMTVQELTSDLAQSFNLPVAEGLLVCDVERGSPADRAQIRSGMLIIRIGNVPVTTEDSIPREIRRIQEGDAVTFILAIAEDQGNLLVQRVNLTARR